MIRQSLREHLIVLVLLLVAVFALPACDRTDAQDEFEDQAFSRPYENITSTTSDGEVIEEDEDDWRVAPDYANSVVVHVPAFPNPTGGELVTIGVNVLFSDGIYGELALYGFTDRDQERLRLIDVIPESRQPGFYTFSFSPTAVSQEPGIRRMFVFDRGPNRERLVTYGDILFQ